MSNRSRYLWSQRVSDEKSLRDHTREFNLWMKDPDRSFTELEDYKVDLYSERMVSNEYSRSLMCLFEILHGAGMLSSVPDWAIESLVKVRDDKDRRKRQAKAAIDEIKRSERDANKRTKQRRAELDAERSTVKRLT